MAALYMFGCTNLNNLGFLSIEILSHFAPLSINSLAVSEAWQFLNAQDLQL